MSHANDGLHRRAMTAAESFKKAKEKSGDYNKRRREATLEYGKVMSEVWTKLEAGESINGATTKEHYCKLLNMRMRWTQTAIQRYRISTGALSAPEPTRTLNFDKPFDYAILGGVKYKVKGLDHNYFPQCGMFGVNIEQGEEKKAEQPKVTHARGFTGKGRLGKNLSLCESRMPALPRTKGKVFAAKSEEATCPKCAEFVNARKAEWEEDGEVTARKLTADETCAAIEHDYIEGEVAAMFAKGGN